MWRCLFDQSLRSKVTKTKYLKNNHVGTWIIKTDFDVSGALMVSNSFLKVIHWMKKGIFGIYEMVKVLILRMMLSKKLSFLLNLDT